MMVDGQIRLVLRHLRKVVNAPQEMSQSDRHLLESFAGRREEAAFEALLLRHGPMVLGVCRRVLRHEQDVEDAFQATFLVLVRKAGSLGREGSLAAWLYTVAYHTALRARADTLRRALGVPHHPPPAPPTPQEEAERRDLRRVLDEEINRLSERYRGPVVLCCLEGKTHEEAARELGCPRGTVAGRLARARQMLRRRLGRRGLSMTAGALGPVMGELALAEPAGAAVPAPLMHSTLAVAVSAPGPGEASGTSPAVLALAGQASRTLGLARVKALTALLLGMAILGGGALGYHTLGGHIGTAGGPGAAPVSVEARGPDAEPALTWPAPPAVRAPAPPGVAAHPTAGALADPPALSDWPLYRGNARRSAQAAGCLPTDVGAGPFRPAATPCRPGAVVWNTSGVLTRDGRVWVARAERGQRGRPVLPGLFPLVAGGKVFHRSLLGIHAVNARTGETEWEVPASWGPDYLFTNKGDPQKAQNLRDWLARSARGGGPLEVLVENSVVGTLSSDGTRVYCIDDTPVPPAGGETGPFRRGAPGAGYNRLLAFNLEDGKPLWGLGGSSVEEAYGKSYFLAPPLPLGGKLYVLNYNNWAGVGGVDLLCLDAEFSRFNVSVEWTAPVASGVEPLGDRPTRRTQAAHVAAGGGLLVCPTNAGTVTAVDPARRKRAWSYTYRDPGTRAPAYGSGWAVTAPLIHDGKVLFAPPDSDSLYCLRLKDGAELWKVRRRGDLYLAGVAGGKVLLVGPRGCRAVRLADGSPAWDLKTGRPSGQGVLVYGLYYLPLGETRAGRPGIVAVDVARGKVVGRLPWDRRDPPGNLVVGQQRLLSQTASRLTAQACGPAPKGGVGFPTLETLPQSPTAETLADCTPKSIHRPPGLPMARGGRPCPNGAGELSMAKPLVSDELWERIQPLLPPPRPRRSRHPGRKPLDARRVLTGILFVLKTGIPWEDLPQEMGCGCGMTALNYLKAWQKAGVWDRIQEVLLEHFHEAAKVNWMRAAGEEPTARGEGAQPPDPFRGVGPRAGLASGGPPGEAATPRPDERVGGRGRDRHASFSAAPWPAEAVLT